MLSNADFLRDDNNIPNPDDEESETDDHIEERNWSTDTEQYTLSEEENNEDPSFNYYIGKDQKTKWKKALPPKNVRTRSKNIITHLPGVKGEARNAKSIFDCWNLFIDDNILECIVTNTNIYIWNIQQNYSREIDANLTNLHEIKALLGIIYFLGVMKANKLNTDDAWARDSTGFELCRIAMSENRFRFLLRVIRFDDKATRNERLRQDKLAAVRLILDTFVKNCQKQYSPSEYIMVDEKLDAFRGKCNFRQYIPSKHNKYGIKLFALVDSKMFYTCNLEIYSGKNPEGPYNVSNSPSDVVERLCEPIKGTGRNVTMDNWFTSYSLALKLLQQYRLTIVGTLKRNKKEIPSEFVISRGRNVHTSVFGFQSEMTLLSYKPKENKVVLMLSTLHHDANIDDSTGELKKPEMIMFYNMPKGGVDMMDEMTATYNCARNSRRWPMVIFYSLLNIGAINSQIIHFANGNASKVKSRRHFLKTLSIDLIEEMVKVCTVSGRIPCEIKEKASDIFNLLEPGPSKKPKIGERHRCKKCQKEKKDRKTIQHCQYCFAFLYGKSMNAELIGEGYFTCVLPNESPKQILVKNVLYVPGMKENLLSVNRLTQLDFEVNFKRNICEIKRNGELCGLGNNVSNIYLLKTGEKLNFVSDGECKNCIHIWHKKLGHRGSDAIEFLMKDQRRILIAKTKELFGRGIKAKLRNNKLIIDDTTYSVVNGTQGYLHNPLMLPTSLNASRNSKDEVISPNAVQFINFLEDNLLVIINGRTKSDGNGEYTYISERGSSVVDYCIVSHSLLEPRIDLLINPLPYSDYMPMVIKMDSNLDGMKLESSTPCTFKKYKWASEKETTFIQNLVAIQGSWNSPIEMLTNNFTNQIRSAMHTAGMQVVITPDGPKSKPWFDRGEGLCGFWKTISLFKNRRTTLGNISIQKWQQFYTELLATSPPVKYDLSIRVILMPDDELMAEISLSEITGEIAHLKRNKACGLDNIPNEAIKALPPAYLTALKDIYNRVLKTGQFPTTWCKTIIHPIFKNGDADNPHNYRGIALLSNLAKLFSSIMKIRLSNWTENRAIIPENQAGFRKEHSHTCQDHIFTLVSLIQLTLRRKRRKFYAFFIDLKKAFDTVRQALLWEKLLDIGLNFRSINLIKYYYENMTAVVRWNNSFTEFIKIKSGVLQVSALTLRRSQRSTKGIPPQRYSLHANYASIREPLNWNELDNLLLDEKKEWLKASEEEMKSLIENDTWTLTDLPPGKKSIGMSALTLRRSQRSTKGIPPQRYSLHANYASIREPLNWNELDNLLLDEKKEWLKASEEEMKSLIENDTWTLTDLPPGKKSIGSKWIFKAKYNQDGNVERFKARLVAKDDFLICSTSNDYINEVKSKLSEHIQLTDMGDATHYLGIKIDKDIDGNILLHQKLKILRILDKYGMSSSKGVSTPLEVGYLNIKENRLLPSNEKYRKLIGELMYIANCTRPEISSAIGILSRRVVKPNEHDLKALKRILGYLKSTLDLVLVFETSSSVELTGYTDADWGNEKDRKSTTGYIYKLGTNLITWVSQKQNSVSLSSTEAEYVAAATAAQEAIWLDLLMSDFGFEIEKPIILNEVNQSCNPFSCQCGLMPFARYLRYSQLTVRSKQSAKCEDPAGSRVVDLLLDCPESESQSCRDSPDLRPKLEALAHNLTLQIKSMEWDGYQFQINYALLGTNTSLPVQPSCKLIRLHNNATHPQLSVPCPTPTEPEIFKLIMPNVDFSRVCLHLLLARGLTIEKCSDVVLTQRRNGLQIHLNQLLPNVSLELDHSDPEATLLRWTISEMDPLESCVLKLGIFLADKTNHEKQHPCRNGSEYLSGLQVNGACLTITFTLLDRHITKCSNFPPPPSPPSPGSSLPLYPIIAVSSIFLVALLIIAILLIKVTCQKQSSREVYKVRFERESFSSKSRHSAEEQHFIEEMKHNLPPPSMTTFRHK
ncbi:hypothetical protein LAZ67_9001767 [Cordylochernes scorpioides]|uniref:LRRCT domain-containing protein n=1 Tax=Cordylochernes scorpioides TaxID=51811 RepID=A0ABY6KT96_9ARAC|nr:hypothetical protein LAZ67_9001767 [Cordylochernes scorpioides]